MDRFGRFLRFYQLEYDKESISDGCRIEKPGIDEDFWIKSDFRDFSYCGPCF